MQMESLYAKLYDKYKELKTKRESEMDQLNCDQEVKFLNYMSAAEELMKHWKTETDRLSEQIHDLRSEVSSIRSKKDEQCAEYQKLLMIEIEKNRELSEEIARLKNQQQLGGSAKGAENESGHRKTSGSAQAGSGSVSNVSNLRMTRKRARLASAESKVDIVTPQAIVEFDHAIVRESANDSFKETTSTGDFVNMQQPACCRRKIDSTGLGIDNANCLFQDLVESLVGMKLSTVNKTDGICISALHQSSGYSFSLTWLNKAGDEAELLYQVLSLGTFELVAPEWMREMLMFSTRMCPIFFDRVSRVIKPQQ